MKRRLHENVYLKLRKEIVSKRQPGDRLPSETELSKHFGVSLVTLRNATSALEADGFIHRISGVGVIVSDRKKRVPIALVNREVGILPRPLYFVLRFSPLLQRNLLRAGWRASACLELESTPDGLDELREGIARSRYAATVWTAGTVPEEFLELSKKNGIPAFGETELPFMRVDYDDMIQKGVDHLVGKGCRKIAGLFSGPPGESARYQDIKASRIFKERLLYHGLHAPAGWVIQHSQARLPGSGWQGFRDLWSTSRERPDGLLVLDDVLYRDAARAILELGVKVPSQLQIVTHSNHGDDLVHPFPVVLLEVDPEEMADAAAEFIIKHLEGEAASVRTIPFRLVESGKLPLHRTTSRLPFDAVP